MYHTAAIRQHKWLTAQKLVREWHMTCSAWGGLRAGGTTSWGGGASCDLILWLTDHQSQFNHVKPCGNKHSRSQLIAAATYSTYCIYAQVEHHQAYHTGINISINRRANEAQILYHYESLCQCKLKPVKTPGRHPYEEEYHTSPRVLFLVCVEATPQHRGRPPLGSVSRSCLMRAVMLMQHDDGSLSERRDGLPAQNLLRSFWKQTIQFHTIKQWRHNDHILLYVF